MVRAVYNARAPPCEKPPSEARGQCINSDVVDNINTKTVFDKISKCQEELAQYF